MIYIIAGVSGSGKTTIGRELSLKLDLPFYDADDYHTTNNIDKLSRGIPLTDDDRSPWLLVLSKKIKEWQIMSGAVLACSALKESYRKKLMCIPEDQIKWIILDANRTVLEERILSRQDHFFNPALLQSQIDTFELPKYGLHIDINQTIEQILINIMNQLVSKSEIGIIGLGVMGRSLARNIADKGVELSVFNRHVDGKEVDVAKEFIAAYPNLAMSGFDNLKMFIDSIKRPRNILLMVNAGTAVDQLIKEMQPHLDEGDCIIDAGNSLYTDSKRRCDELSSLKLNFLGVGVSGGEEGALKGPSIMPGGSKLAYENNASILDKIAAKDKNGRACSSYIGPEGAGHFVKMIHNGIEYAEMQMIVEVYHYMRYYAQYPSDKIIKIFQSWQSSHVGSYLLEATIDILQVKDGDELLLDMILDKASNKGTGGWSTESAIQLGKPISTISEALMARFLSSMKEERVKASKLYAGMKSKIDDVGIDSIKTAYHAGRMINHAIGFDILQAASGQNNWDLELSEIARIWTSGCIIRSSLMEQLADLNNLEREHLLMVPEIATIMNEDINDLQVLVASALKGGCAVPVLSASLNYFLGFITKNSSANLIQAQRDYFGAHTYQRHDESKDSFFHTQWK